MHQISASMITPFSAQCLHSVYIEDDDGRDVLEGLLADFSENRESLHRGVLSLL